MIGDPKYYKVCKAMFMCDTPYASTKGFEDKLDSNFAKAKELLKEGGYDGTPVVLMHSTDLYVLANLAPVAKSLMEKAGIKVDMQSMDWQTLVSRRAKQGSAGQGRLERVHDLVGLGRHRRPAGQHLHQRGRRQGLVRLAHGRGAGQAARRSSPTRPTRPSARRWRVAMQVRVAENPTHTFLGQWYAPVALRKNITGNMESPVTVFWNIEKK